MTRAYAIASARQNYNVQQGIKDKYGLAPDPYGGLQLHKIGARGECATALEFEIAWDGNLGQFTAPDVGDFQVRTRSKTWYDLILHPADNDDDIFIHATSSEENIVVLRGWIYGRDGKKQVFWKDPAGGRPAFFVSEFALRSMDQFEEIARPQVSAPEQLNLL